MKSKKLFLIVFLFLPLLMVDCSCWRNQSDKNKVGPKEDVKVTSNPEARLYFKFIGNEKKNFLAQSGDIEISKKEVEKLTFFRGIEQKRKEILFTLVYQQFVAYQKKAPAKIVFFLGSMRRSVESLLNQYALPLRKETKIEFKKNQEGGALAKVGSQLIAEKDLDKNNFLWGKLQTIEFQGYLKGIDQVVKERKVLSEARKQNLNVQDYIQDYIYKNIPSEIPEKELESARLERGLPKNAEGKAKARQWLTKKRQIKHYNYFLEKYLLDLPILVNLKRPEFQLKIESEFVPRLGAPSSEVELTLFTDPNNGLSNDLASQIGQILKEYQGIGIEVRPILASENSFDLLRAKVDFCVWTHFPDSFISYYSKTRGQFSSQTHEKLFARIGQLKLSQEKIEKCIHSEQATQAIDYHRKYARYLGLFVGPVVFVSGEVLGPEIVLKDVTQVINRRLNRADAALWD